MPLFKRRGNEPEKAETAPQQAAKAGLPEEVVAQEYQLKLYYAGKSTEGVRIKAGPRALAELPGMLTGLARGASRSSIRWSSSTPRRSPRSRGRPRRCSGSTRITS